MYRPVFATIGMLVCLTLVSACGDSDTQAPDPSPSLLVVPIEATTSGSDTVSVSVTLPTIDAAVSAATVRWNGQSTLGYMDCTGGNGSGSIGAVLSIRIQCEGIEGYVSGTMAVDSEGALAVDGALAWHQVDSQAPASWSDLSGQEVSVELRVGEPYMWFVDCYLQETPVFNVTGVELRLELDR